MILFAGTVLEEIRVVSLNKSVFIVLGLVQIVFGFAVLILTALLASASSAGTATLLTVVYITLSCLFPAGLLMLPLFLGKPVR